MERDILLEALKHHKAVDCFEEANVLDTIKFIEQHPDCFERTNLAGHVTGSAWILNEARSATLLIHHVKLDKWFQPGGHADGDTDIMSVAMKEANEETGLIVRPVSFKIFDVDVHPIPARPGIPEHFHYDIRYAFTPVNSQDAFSANREIKAAEWVALKDVSDFNNSRSVMRMVLKSLVLLKHPGR